MEKIHLKHRESVTEYLKFNSAKKNLNYFKSAFKMIRNQLFFILMLTCIHLQGGVIFERKMWTIAMLCQIVLEPQIQNFTFNVAF